MSDPRTPSPGDASLDTRPRFPTFAGFPYLVTRIGATALRHIILLPSEWPEPRLVAAARRQSLMNALQTALCLAPGHAVFFDADGSAAESDVVPTGIPLSDRLAPSVEVPPDPELHVREGRLRSYVAEHRPDGYLVGDGLEGGRTATAEELTALAWSGEDMPPGLRPCGTCHELAGEFLRDEAEHEPSVVDVRCRCDNPNRCARCGERLYERALSAWFWEDQGAEPGVIYVPAFVGLSHRC